MFSSDLVRLTSQSLIFAFPLYTVGFFRKILSVLLIVVLRFLQASAIPLPPDLTLVFLGGFGVEIALVVQELDILGVTVFGEVSL